MNFKHLHFSVQKEHSCRTTNSQTAFHAGPRRGESPPIGLAWNNHPWKISLPAKWWPWMGKTHPGKLSKAGKWQERWYTLGQRSQHSNSPPLRHTAQKSSFSIGAGGPFLTTGARGMSLCSSGDAPSTSGDRCPARDVTVTFLPPRLGAWVVSGRLFWLTLGKKRVWAIRAHHQWVVEGGKEKRCWQALSRDLFQDYKPAKPHS